MLDWMKLNWLGYLLLVYVVFHSETLWTDGDTLVPCLVGDGDSPSE
jgi:hypothetical protein